MHALLGSKVSAVRPYAALLQYDQPAKKITKTVFSARKAAVHLPLGLAV